MNLGSKMKIKTKDDFENRKEELLALIECELEKIDLDKRYRKELSGYLEILNEYSYENRMKKKGILSHIIVDSYLDHGMQEGSITAKVSQFDYDVQL